MDGGLFSFVWRHGRARILWLILAVTACLPLWWLLLEVTKTLINRPIRGAGYDVVNPDVAALGLPAGEAVQTTILGFAVTRGEDLILLCAAFLTLHLAAGGLKLLINTQKGRLGERLLWRLRYHLVDVMLRAPPKALTGRRPGAMAAAVGDEIEPLGGFMGDAVVQPLYLAGQIVVATAFVAAQNLALGLVALAVIALQAAVAPRLRRKLPSLARERMLAGRRLSGRIAALAEAAPRIAADASGPAERAAFARRLSEVYALRFRLYRRKHAAKFVANMLNHLGPLAFYAVGGWFAIRGDLDVGQLVAAIAAHRALPGPIEELIDWDQRRLDAALKTAEIAELFDIADLRPPEPAPAAPPPRLGGPLVLRGAALKDRRLPDLDLRGGEAVLLRDAEGGAGAALAAALRRQRRLRAGAAQIGGAALQTLPRATLGRRVAVVEAEPMLLERSVGETLLAAVRRGQGSDGDMAGRDAIDLADLGLRGPDELIPRQLAALEAAGLGAALRDAGLDARLAPAAAEPVMQARALLRYLLEEDGDDARRLDLIEPFDTALYAREASIGVNIAFGAPRAGAGALAAFLCGPRAAPLLAAQGVTAPLLGIGWTIATQAVTGDARARRRLAPLISREETDALRALFGARRRLSRDARVDVMTLALRYVEPRDGLGLLDAGLEARLVALRLALAARCGPALAGLAERFDLDRPNASASVLENVVFGNPRSATPEAAARVRMMVAGILTELRLEGLLARAGLTHGIGPGGEALSPPQRRRLALARALFRMPDYLLIDHAFDDLDDAARAALQADLDAYWRETGRRPGLLWVGRADTPAAGFDRALDAP